MLFKPQYEVYEGPDCSDLIGDEWMDTEMEEGAPECFCVSQCTVCGCMGEEE